MVCFFFFKQKTAYERRISDWSSDVCSSDLSDDNAFVAGLSIPLPVFNRNQGGVAEARAELARATYDRDGALQRLQRMLGTAYAELLTARSEERRVGKECVSTFGSREWPDH